METVTGLHDLTAMLPDGSTAGYAVYGDPNGRPVLALHGAPACRLMFAFGDTAARALGLKLIAPDRPGYGMSPATGEVTLESRTAWLTAFADAAGLDRFALLAISGGGPYGVALAAKLGGRIHGLALVSPVGPVAEYARSAQAMGPLSLPHRAFFLHISQWSVLTRSVSAILPAIMNRVSGGMLGLGSRLAGAGDTAILSRPDVRAALIAMTQEAFKQGGSGAADDLRIYGQPWRVDCACVIAPAILWQGSADRIVPPAAACQLAKALPACRLNMISGAGHFWVLDHMDEVLCSVRDFFPR